VNGPRDILVTSALPYANGPIHLGHLVEYIQTDIWARFQRMRGHRCYYVCADDTHGTPIMLRAEVEQVAPEQLIARMQEEHLRDFTEFHIAFDNYYSTNSQENRALAEGIYLKLKARGLIESRTIEQLYDPVKNMFLPDRFIKGECPRCHGQDQYGDACEICGGTYQPTELINPYSALSGAAPIRKQSDHYFFRLRECEDFLREWTRAGHLQPEAANKLNEWLRSRRRRGNISMSGWMHRLVTWRVSRISASTPSSTSMRTGERRRRPSSITSSGKTSCISMPCSGPRCCILQAIARPPGSSRTASSP
jgi:methionyl-tRNA synthetase